MPILVPSGKDKDKHTTVIFLKQDYKKRIIKCIKSLLEILDLLVLGVSFRVVPQSYTCRNNSHMEVDTKSPIGLANLAPLFIGSAAKLESYIFSNMEVLK